MKYNSYKITEHTMMQLFSRRISAEDVELVIESGEIIKEYKDDKPFPSFLILMFVADRPLHVVYSVDENNKCFIITAYEPDTATWDKDFKQKNHKEMKCVICKTGETQKGYVTVFLEREGSIIAIKEVEADVCQNCGEYYLSTETAKKVSSQAEESFRKGVEIEVIKMKKAS